MDEGHGFSRAAIERIITAALAAACLLLQMHAESQSRPTGVTAISALFFAASALSLATAIATFQGWWPLAWGRYIAGDLAIMGPAVFFIAAIIYFAAGWGLLRLKNWARRLAIVVGVLGLYFLVPEVSSAAADLRIRALATGGLQVIVRVVVLLYLFQQRVGETFVGVVEIR